MGANRLARSYGMGQPVRRVEDARFLTGRGTYIDDVQPAGQSHAFIVLSPHAHAHIRKIDAAAARQAPGVLCILTGEDVKAEGLGGLPPNFMPEDIGGPKGLRTRRPILAVGKVRCVGDRVAMVVAETLTQARDAAELLAIDYEPLPAVVNVEDAVAPGAPPVWDECPGNVSFTLAVGDEKATAAAFAAATHRISLRLENNRLAPNAMEPRAALGQYEPADGNYTLYTSSQAPHAVRSQVAGHVFGLPETSVRVDRPRRRRRLRRQGGCLSRGRAGAVGGPQVRPAGQVDRNAIRRAARRQSWPRPGRPRRARARCRRQDPGDPRPCAACGRRVYRVGGGGAAALFAALCAGRLRRTDAMADDEGGLHPHDAARGLSRCRPSRGHLSSPSA